MAIHTFGQIANFPSAATVSIDGMNYFAVPATIPCPPLGVFTVSTTGAVSLDDQGTPPAIAGTSVSKAIMVKNAAGQLAQYGSLTINAKSGTTTTPVNNPPTKTGQQVDVSVESGQALTPIDFSNQISDPDGDTLAFSMAPSVPGISINATTGVLSGTPTAVGSTSITVTGSDGEFSEVCTFIITVTPAATTHAQIRTSVESITNTARRTSTNSLVPIDVATLPAGVNLTATEVNITQPVVLEDVDWGNRRLRLLGGSSGSVIRQNQSIITVPLPITHSNIQIDSGVDDVLIENNDLAGLKGWSGSYVGGPSGDPRAIIFQENVPGSGAPVRIFSNQMKWASNDFVKLSGNFEATENWIHSSSNADMFAVPWNNTTNYAVGDFVNLPGDPRPFIQYVCIQAHSGQSPVASTTTAFWGFYDPHTDMINPFRSQQKDSLIHRNLLLRDAFDSLIPVADQAFGLGHVNAVRLVPNNGDTTPYRRISVTENVMRGVDQEDDASFINQASREDVAAADFARPFWDKNIIEPRGNGTGHFHPTTLSVSDFGVNCDYQTLQPL